MRAILCFAALLVGVAAVVLDMDRDGVLDK